MIKGIDFPNKKQLWLIVAILALVIFYLAKCRTVPTPQTITTTKILKDTLRLIEQDRKKIEDSFNLVLQKHYKADEFNNGQFVNLVNQNEELAAINEKMQMELSYPDTCQEVVNKLNSSYNTYVAQTKQTIEQSKKSLFNLRQTIS